MSLQERSGKRDLTMSAWHRRNFGDEASALDLDLVGMCKFCSSALYVWETTRAEHKTTTWTELAAVRMNVPAFLIRYSANTDGSVASMTVHQVSPVRRLIGGEIDLKIITDRLRSAHAALIHDQYPNGRHS